MKAVVIKEYGLAVVADVKEPSPRAGYHKIKTVALAVNPSDLHHTAGAGRIGGIIGVDLAGIVEEVGEDCPNSDIQKGDKVFGVSHCANHNEPEDGAFGEFAMVRDGHLAKIPSNMSFEEAATLGTGITSVGQALYLVSGLPLPGEGVVESQTFILISGGSSATGTIAIQYAKLSGLTVIATASPKNFDLVKDRGADVVFDYNDPECARKIKEASNNTLHYVLDAIATETSYKVIADALPEKSEKPIHVVTLLPDDTWPRKDVKPTVILAYTTFGHAFHKFGIDFPAMPDHFAFGVKFWKLNSELVAAGKIKNHPVASRSGGLSGIPGGLAEHAARTVSAVKLVYRVDETTESDGTEGITSIKAPELGSAW